MKRSSQKIITQKARVLRHLRVSKGISQREAGRRCGLSDAAVGHYENGRMDVSDERLQQFLEAYGWARDEYEEFLGGKEIPIVSVKEECLHLLDKLDEQQLRTVHAVLLGFLGRS